jgi:hypothetical protein
LTSEFAFVFEGFFVEFIFAAAGMAHLSMISRDPFGGKDSKKGKGSSRSLQHDNKKGNATTKAGPPPAAKDDNQKTKQKQKGNNQDDGNTKLQQILRFVAE